MCNRSDPAWARVLQQAHPKADAQKVEASGAAVKEEEGEEIKEEEEETTKGSHSFSAEDARKDRLQAEALTGSMSTGGSTRRPASRLFQTIHSSGVLKRCGGRQEQRKGRGIGRTVAPDGEVLLSGREGGRA